MLIIKRDNIIYSLIKKELEKVKDYRYLQRNYILYLIKKRLLNAKEHLLNFEDKDDESIKILQEYFENVENLNINQLSYLFFIIHFKGIEVEKENLINSSIFISEYLIKRAIKDKGKNSLNAFSNPFSLGNNYIQLDLDKSIDELIEEIKYIKEAVKLPKQNEKIKELLKFNDTKIPLLEKYIDVLYILDSFIIKQPLKEAKEELFNYYFFTPKSPEYKTIDKYIETIFKKAKQIL